MGDVIARFKEQNSDLPFDVDAQREAFNRLVEMEIDPRSWRAILIVRQSLLYELPSAAVRIVCADGPWVDTAALRVAEIDAGESADEADHIRDEVVRYVARHYPGRTLNLRDDASTMPPEGRRVYAVYFANNKIVEMRSPQ